MVRPHETTDGQPLGRDQERQRLDPKGLLLRLAFAAADAHDLSAKELSAAKAILCAPGGLGYAYRVLDDAALLREQLSTTAFDPNAPLHNALTQLLLDDTLDLDDEVGLAAPNPAKTIFDILSSLRLFFAGGGVLATAALLVVLLPTNATDESAPSPTIAPARVAQTSTAKGAVKGPHVDRFFSPPLRLVSDVVTGPLSRESVLDSLSRSVRDIARCGSGPGEWTLRFDVNAQGLAANIDVVTAAATSSTHGDRDSRVTSSERLGERQAECVADAVRHTAFDFAPQKTRVHLVIAHTGGE